MVVMQENEIKTLLFLYITMAMLIAWNAGADIQMDADGLPGQSNDQLE